MSDPQTVVVYRSQMERQTDMFFYDNPEYGLYLVGAIVGLILIVWGRMWWSSKRPWRK